MLRALPTAVSAERLTLGLLVGTPIAGLIGDGGSDHRIRNAGRISRSHLDLTSEDLNDLSCVETLRTQLGRP